jgi:hypothetical protein
MANREKQAEVLRRTQAKRKELKHQNEILRGHIAEIYEIRDENKRLQTQLRELISPNPASKVVSINTSTKENKAISSLRETSNETEES